MTPPPKLTVFSIPRAFWGRTGIIQTNAIRSWTRLEAAEVILIGDEEGAAQAAQDLRLRHIPNVALNEFGTPLVSSAFRLAEQASRAETMCYVNADIILLSHLLRVLELLDLEQFVLVGNRWNVRVEWPLPLERPDFEDWLRGYVSDGGRLHPALGSDFFVYRKGMWGEIPPFAVGRAVWDNWLIYRARQLGLPVIDVTPSVMVVHQDHDYDHVSGDFATSGWKGPEADVNRALAGGPNNIYTLYDATHVFDNTGLRRTRGLRYLERRVLHAFPILKSLGRPLARSARRLARALSSQAD